MRYRSRAVNDKLIRFVGKKAVQQWDTEKRSVTQFDDDNGRVKHVCKINWPKHK